MSEAPSISELERRMRPGAYSQKGFLGRTESLEAVVAQDEQTLHVLGVSHEQIAAALERVLQSVDDQSDQLYSEGKHDEVFKREEGPFPHIRAGHLPNPDVGYLVGGNLQVFVERWRGFQNCPWQCAEPIRWAYLDFLLLNRESGKCLTGPGMIVHLIRAHHFFEGRKSPYRVDPEEAIQVLELAPEADRG
jgi:hypothetical protein